MKLEMLEFTLNAKAPTPLFLISWNWASKCLLGIHFHSNFPLIPEAGEGKGAFLPSFLQGRITPILYWEIGFRSEISIIQYLLSNKSAENHLPNSRHQTLVSLLVIILNSPRLDMLVFWLGPWLTKGKITGKSRNRKIIEHLWKLLVWVWFLLEAKSQNLK